MDIESQGLMGLGFNDDAVGATRPASVRWTGTAGYRSIQKTVRIGVGSSCWVAASTAVLSWGEDAQRFSGGR